MAIKTCATRFGNMKWVENRFGNRIEIRKMVEKLLPVVMFSCHGFEILFIVQYIGYPDDTWSEKLPLGLS